MSEDFTQSANSKPRVGFVHFLYQLAIGIFSAVALLALAEDFLHLRLSGPLEITLSTLAQHTRTLVSNIIHDVMIGPIDTTFHVKTKIPVELLDYLIVGLTILESHIRTDVWRNRVKGVGYRYIALAFLHPKAVFFTLLTIFTWPLDVIVAIYVIASGKTPIGTSVTSFDRGAMIISLSPIIYFVLLMAANYTALKFNT